MSRIEVVGPSEVVLPRVGANTLRDGASVAYPYIILLL